jgi:inorganic pyrophosphatase
VSDLGSLPTFAGDEACHVVVESPRGSAVKFKYDAERGVVMMSRPLPAGLTYPHDWGFVPSTRAADGDPLDAMIVWDGTSYPGIVVTCRPIGVLQVEQTNPKTHARERNDRLVVLPTAAPRWEAILSVFDLSERVRLELERFFAAAVAFEKKELTLLGWAGPDAAMKLVTASRT